MIETLAQMEGYYTVVRSSDAEGRLIAVEMPAKRYGVRIKPDADEETALPKLQTWLAEQMVEDAVKLVGVEYVISAARHSAGV